MQVIVLVVQNSVPADQIGTATSTNNYFREVGASLGVAVFGSIFTTRLSESLTKAFTGAGASAEQASQCHPDAGPADAQPAPGAAPDAIVNAYADSLAPVFWYLLPFIGIALILRPDPQADPAVGHRRAWSPAARRSAARKPSGSRRNGPQPASAADAAETTGAGRALSATATPVVRPRRRAHPPARLTVRNSAAAAGAAVSASRGAATFGGCGAPAAWPVAGSGPAGQAGMAGAVEPESRPAAAGIHRRRPCRASMNRARREWPTAASRAAAATSRSSRTPTGPPRTNRPQSSPLSPAMTCPQPRNPRYIAQDDSAAASRRRIRIPGG